MSRLLSTLCAGCAVGIGLAAWYFVPSDDPSVEIPASTQPATARTDQVAQDAALQVSSEDATTPSNKRQALQTARAACSLPAIEAAVRTLTEQANESKAAEDWHILAEAHLECALQRAHLVGMTPGKPTYSELPAPFAKDLSAGLAAVKQARELGDESGELYRVEAALMSQHITGLGAALKWNAKINEALKTAGELQAEDPNLHVALGLRKLLAPTWFGHDPQKALQHFEFACDSMDDERPAIFAAMATYLQDKRDDAIGWLEQALQRNPRNKYAQAVLKRLQKGEEDPFGRDVTEAEINSAK